MLRKESHNIEYKQSWRDEFMKTICAFANMDGGTLLIGKDDNGKTVGVDKAKKLLEDIPNKVISQLGVVADVRLKRDKRKDFLSIKVKSYEVPISFRGKYYIRSGSTTQELNGAELQKFLLQKSGLSWESLVEDRATLKDIDTNTVAQFKALAAKRFPAAASEKSVSGLLTKLHLIQKGKPIRAAILLFGKDPQQFYPGSFIKIGRFKDDATLLSMDEIKGNLFQHVEAVLDVLKKKYLHAEVKIEGLHREEDLEYPEEALREAIVNSIAHRDYSAVHSQLKVYSDQLVLWNNGNLTHGLTVEKLKKSHNSHPRNERIAGVFFMAGYIEAWGHGTVRMVKECKDAGLPEPVYEETGGGMQVTFLKDIYRDEYLRKIGLSERQVKGVLYTKEYGAITNSQYQEVCEISKRTATNDLRELLGKEILQKIGVTGKGTRYILQRGNKGAKGAKPSTMDKLDKKLSKLEKELDLVDSNMEIKDEFNKKVFFQIYDSWLTDLLVELIPLGQKFNHLFRETRHHVFVISGIGRVNFTNEKPLEVIRKLRENCQKNAGAISSGARVEFSLSYNTLIKGGLKTFGCSYHVEVEFQRTRFSLFMDEFVDKSLRTKVLQHESLLHKPIKSNELKTLTEKLGNTIYDHIDFCTKEQGIL